MFFKQRLNGLLGAQPLSNAMVMGTLLMLSSRPLAAEEKWKPDAFDYDPPARLDVHEAPIRQAYQIAGTRQEELVFTNLRGEPVPLLMTKPARGDGPFPVVILVHGFASNKEEVSRQLSGLLTQRGFATIAVDLPHHGERAALRDPATGAGQSPAADSENMFGPDRKKAYGNVVQGVKDVRQTIDVAQDRREFDTSDGVYLAGYSMGSWIGTLAAAADRRVKAMVLMVAGSAVTLSQDLKHEGLGIRGRLELVHHYPVLRHNLALPHFAPRPVIMMNGKRDALVPEARAKALFESAGAPKEQRWYDSGHLLPINAYREAAEWLAGQVKRSS